MLLEGKNGIIFGVANKRSIAWSIAQAAKREGANLVFNFLDERLEAKVNKLAQSLVGEGENAPPVLRCNVEKDEELDTFFEQAGELLGGRIDFLVHAVAYANREDLEGTYVKTGRGGFATALSVSAYSLTALAQRAAPLMTAGGSIVALTYLGAERVLPGYNVMGVAKSALEASVRYLACDLGPGGIRVNALSAGPIQTLSARGIKGFSEILNHYAARSALRKNTDPDEVADATVFLLSNMGRGITGETIYVDGGYRITGM
ncbi:MAG: enoyl-ACP reductase FabI [Planctomycetota bacterium]|jgi:enoyl-[acyl-carrier protein] reductase I